MKICPRCQRTYTDDNLNFCLDDGVVLQQTSAEPPETVFMNQPRPTAPNASSSSQPGVQPGWNTAPQQYSQPKKSSKTWIWVLLILGLVVLLCGGGFIGFFAYIASQVDTNTVANSSTPSNTKTITGTKSTPSGPSASPDDRDNVQDVDLSEWVKEFSVYGVTEFTGGEFIMSSKQKKFYYVLVAPDDYSTEGANTRVTLRNIDNADSSLGYGLIFHSNPTPLLQDYAFLIDTKKKKYKVVRHLPSDEKSVIPWTNSTYIKDGAQENTLEIRDKADKVELYINGQLVNSIRNTDGYKNGVPGLYSGDGVRIAFKDLQIVK